jgi:hypothetical protein
MSDFQISIDWATLRKTSTPLTQAHVDAAASIYRQCRTEDDIRRDNQQAQADYERERNEGWSVR